jgi:Zn-dependent protease with chaperone function
MIGLLQTLFVSSALLGVVVWVVLMLVRPGQRLARTTDAPFARLVVARLWLYGIVWFPALVSGAALIPGIWSLASRQLDHCNTHGGAHGHHLCVVHPPHASTEPAFWLLAAALFTLGAGVLSLFARRVVREVRLAGALVALSQPTGWGDNVRLLEGVEPVACTIGAGRATILLSQGLVDQLTPPQLHIVLAHEHTHARRSEVMSGLADRFVCLLLPPVVSRPLMSQILLAREQLCDARAARVSGSPLDVAATILAVARLGVHRPCTGHYFGDGDLEARIQHLLTPTVHSRRWMADIVTMLMVIAALGAGPLHVAIEALTTAILH